VVLVVLVDVVVGGAVVVVGGTVVVVGGTVVVVGGAVVLVVVLDVVEDDDVELDEVVVVGSSSSPPLDAKTATAMAMRNTKISTTAPMTDVFWYQAGSSSPGGTVPPGPPGPAGPPPSGPSGGCGGTS
jgi:hypothetical protein